MRVMHIRKVNAIGVCTRERGYNVSRRIVALEIQGLQDEGLQR